MAAVVSAGNYIQANVRIQNIGQQAGHFKLSGIIVPHGQPESAKVQTFYNAKGYSSTNQAPAGADAVTTSSVVAPNDTVALTMFSDMWADGNPLKYSSQQIFDAIFKVLVTETSESFTFVGDSAFQHQTLAPARPEVVGVDYIILLA